MIILTKLGGGEIMINDRLIESVVQTPDTLVNMNTGHSFIVCESISEIMDKILNYNRSGRRRLRPRADEAEEK